VVHGLALTCKFPVWHSGEGPETAADASGFLVEKPAHTVHVNFNFNFNFNWHFLKDHVEQGTIKLRYLPIDEMVADMFTKPLP
jgi:hypothetical protein